MQNLKLQVIIIVTNLMIMINLELWILALYANKIKNQKKRKPKKPKILLKNQVKKEKMQ